MPYSNAGQNDGRDRNALDTPGSSLLVNVCYTYSKVTPEVCHTLLVCCLLVVACFDFLFVCLFVCLLFVVCRLPFVVCPFSFVGLPFVFDGFASILPRRWSLHPTRMGTSYLIREPQDIPNLKQR